MANYTLNPPTGVATMSGMKPVPLSGAGSPPSSGGGPASVSGSQGGGGGAGVDRTGGWGGGGMINPYEGAISPAGLAAFSMPSDSADAQQAQANGSSPALSRLSNPTATSSMPQQQSNEVWVTVPVDKVEVVGGKGTVTPVYATADGYQSPASGNAIPPTPAAGRVART